MKRKILIIVILAILIIAAAVYAQVFTSRARTVDGMQVGEVVVDNQVPIRLRFAAGGLTPAERAAVVARRLSQMNNLGPSEIGVSKVGSYWGVTARGQLLVTADNAHALANNTTPQRLATNWANQLRSSLLGTPVTPTPPTTPATPATPAPPAPTETAQKVVPIISVGSGLRIGAALVGGSETQVAKVTAVAQIEGQFGSRVRLRGLVPVETENVVSNLRRVPGTAVIAVADLRL